MTGIFTPNARDMGRFMSSTRIHFHFLMMMELYTSPAVILVDTGHAMKHIAGPETIEISAFPASST